VNINDKEVRFPHKVISCSENRKIHESKKEWLKTQGINFGEYDLRNVPEKHKEYWGGLNFYWCFADAETATMFRLRWGEK